MNSTNVEDEDCGHDFQHATDPSGSLGDPHRLTVSGLTTHAYLWTRPGRNVLFYSPATDADFDAIDELGGVDDQYLSHQDEAGPMLATIVDRFGSRLHAPATELVTIGQHAH